MRHAVLLLCILAIPVSAQVPTIIQEIGELESVRDPKCYATASRLEDFIYGTPLEPEARFEKIAMQKAYIRSLWEKASLAAADQTEITVEALRPVLQSAVPYVQNADGSFRVRDMDITARDRRQYGSIAYALRAILGVQQDAFYADATKLLPLSANAVELFKESVDLTTLAALQRADREARKRNRERIDASLFRDAWKAIVPTSSIAPTPQHSAMMNTEKFATIKAIVAEKLAAYEAYNNLAMPVFLRNLQVYMARHMWPSDPEEGKAFRDQFTEVMVAWTADVMLEAERLARKAGHPLIRVEDVHAALQTFEPHEANQYEDIIYFPRLPKSERIVIEAYDLDSFRDPGIHWLYLSEALKNPEYKGTIEPDPFAAELLVEGAAQFGVLVLRVAGMIATQEEKDRLESAHLTKALTRIQALLDKHAAAPPLKKTATSIASAKSGAPVPSGTFFTDVTPASGIAFEHRLSDWLARFIRGYTVLDGG